MDELLTKARSIAINSFALALYEAQSYMPPPPRGEGVVLNKVNEGGSTLLYTILEE